MKREDQRKGASYRNPGGTTLPRKKKLGSAFRLGENILGGGRIPERQGEASVNAVDRELKKLL